MKRREFIALLGGGAAATWPIAGRSQQAGRRRRIAALLPYLESDAVMLARLTAFREGLQKAGWSEGNNLQIEYRWGLGDAALTGKYARELVELKPELIVTSSNGSATLLSSLTSTIPIVFASASDPFETGLVADMAHPGANVTGFTQLEAPISGKYLDLLRETIPGLSRVLVLYGSVAGRTPATIPFMRVLATVAPQLGIEIVPVASGDAAELTRSFDAISSWRGRGGAIVLSSPITTSHREQIIALAARYRVPAIYPYRDYPAEGGLMSFGPDLIDQYRQAASYVDRILRGEKPGDLPVQAPTKYETVINLKTAKALGLDIPATLLARADEVIE